MNDKRLVEDIAIYKIIPNIYQPRIKFDEKSISDLAKSIKEYGVIQPLILRKSGNSYEIIDGERRYRAAKKINLQSLPAIILDVDDKKAMELILIDNMQKKLLSPIEEANAYQQMMLLNKWNIEQLAGKLDQNRNIIETKLKLLTLAPEIQTALLENKISEGHAKVLTKLSNKDKQLNLFDKVINERLTVKTLEDKVLVELKQLSERSKDKISLNDLNRMNFSLDNLENQKEEKMEEKNMDNNQLNFNQYNNLLKEQEKPVMEMNAQPTAIIGNTVVQEPKPNAFFPSLEEQPLNLDVPVNGQNDIPSAPVQMPEVPTMDNMQSMPTMDNTFNIPSGPVQMPEMGPVMENVQNVNAPVMDSNFNIPGAPVQMPEVPIMDNMQSMPAMDNTFNVPSGPVQMPEMGPVMENTQNVNAPVMDSNFNIPGAPVQMPEVPTMDNMQSMPTMDNTFNVPSGPVQMPEMGPVMENVQTVNAPVMDSNFNIPNAPVQMPEVPTMDNMQSMPTMDNTFNVPGGPVQMPEMGPVMENVQNVNAPQIKTDVMPAVNMIRNLIPLLQNSGYVINIEESDNFNEYQVVLKVQK